MTLYLFTLADALGAIQRIYIRAASHEMATDYLESAFPNHSIVGVVP